MFPSRESGDISINDYYCNFTSCLTNVECIDISPDVSSECSPVYNVDKKNSSNSCKYFNNVFNNAVTYSVNNACKHYYSPAEFYNHHPENRKIFSGTCRRLCSNNIKPPRDVLKTSFKKKRKRTTFTTEQIIALEEVFNKRPYINREERIMMTKKLQINEKSIKVWFQNRRRLTDKRSKEYRSDSPSSDVSDSYSDRLAIIESNINQSTDSYGFVRLDNRTMAELVNIIDEYLSQDPNSHVEESTQPVVSLSNLMYEPISPVSLTENQEETDLRRDLETKSSEHLIDIESLLFY